MEKPIVSIMLDTRKEATGKDLYSIKVRASFVKVVKGKKVWFQKYYPLKRYVTKKDFTAINGGVCRTSQQREIRTEITKVLEKANMILETHSFVTEELFTRLYTGASNLEGVAGLFDLKISELQKEGRIGSRDVYRAVKNSVIRFSGGVTFHEVTVEWIKCYESWLRSHKVKEKTLSLSSTTIGIYLRHLRAVYNMAMNLKLINRDMYPFGRGGYVIRKSQSRKIALTEADKDRLLLISDPELRYAADFWMFSYYCYGLNMADVCLLKIRDLKDDLLIIGREKKKNTDASGKMMVIPIREEVKEIINRWGNKSLNPDEYVFPILTQGLSPEQMKDRTKDFTKAVNAGLKKIGEKLKLDFKLTTYTARHTFANVALKKGASIEFIQDALGHGSKITTQNYLAGFDVEAKRAMSAKL